MDGLTRLVKRRQAAMAGVNTETGDTWRRSKQGFEAL